MKKAELLSSSLNTMNENEKLLQLYLSMEALASISNELESNFTIKYNPESKEYVTRIFKKSFISEDLCVCVSRAIFYFQIKKEEVKSGK